MKVVLVFACLVAAVYGEACSGNDVSTCLTTDCTSSSLTLACEHGLCTCANGCTQASDCASFSCQLAHHTMHCVDSLCLCDPNGGNANHHPGNHHPGGPHPG